MNSTTVSLLLAGGAIVISLFSIDLQVFAWKQGNQSDVTAEIDGPSKMPIGHGKYEIDVVMRNRGPDSQIS